MIITIIIIIIITTLVVWNFSFRMSTSTKGTQFLVLRVSQVILVFIVIRQKMSKPCSDCVYGDTFELLMWFWVSLHSFGKVTEETFILMPSVVNQCGSTVPSMEN